MKTKHKSFLRLFLAVVILLINLGSMPGTAYAAEGVPGVTISVAVTNCGEVEYTINNSSDPYLIVMSYGDGIKSGELELDSDGITLNHTYSVPGDYVWTVEVFEIIGKGEFGTASGEITIAGPPAVTIISDPFPPLVGPGTTVIFKASVTDGTGTPPFTYAWGDANGDGIDDGVTAETPSILFAAADKYQAQVTVTDFNGCIVTETLSVVVVDPEVDPGDTCHPTAQKIADAVNTIFPTQAGDLYTCEEILGIFNGVLTGDQVGFGRMWKAYNLAQTMEDLTWEEIRDWGLDTGGWGALLQLDRFSDLLETHSLPDMMGLVMSEEYTLGDVRTAVRSTTRYEADFDDALARILSGATASELGQFYKLAADLEVTPAELDDYLAGEFALTLSQLKHTAKVAHRMEEVDWTDIAAAGGVQDYLKDLREADQAERAEQKAIQQAERAEQQAAQQKDKNQQTADKLAEQYPDYPGGVMSLFDVGGDCEGDWGCVRKTLREQENTQANGPPEQNNTQADGPSEKDNQTAHQIASKYGIADQVVLDQFNDCGGDWGCTRSYFREQSMENKETGKPDK